MNKKFSMIKQAKEKANSTTRCESSTDSDENNNKTCPFLDCQCLREGCQLFYKECNNCQINLLSYNLYRLHNDLIS
jgi:hypothetical protein